MLGSVRLDVGWGGSLIMWSGVAAAAATAAAAAAAA